VIGTPRTSSITKYGRPLSVAPASNARDVRMIHQRHRLSLGFEARDELLRVEAELDQLQGDAPTHRLFLLGHEDDPARALANALEEFVGAEVSARAGLEQVWGTDLAQAGIGIGNSGERCILPGARRRFEKTTVFLVAAEQFLYVGSHRTVVATRMIDKHRAFARWPRQCIGKNCFVRGSANVAHDAKKEDEEDAGSGESARIGI
jgi:hypothetical protein